MPGKDGIPLIRGTRVEDLGADGLHYRSWGSGKLGENTIKSRSVRGDITRHMELLEDRAHARKSRQAILPAEISLNIACLRTSIPEGIPVCIRRWRHVCEDSGKRQQRRWNNIMTKGAILATHSEVVKAQM